MMGLAILFGLLVYFWISVSADLDYPDKDFLNNIETVFSVDKLPSVMEHPFKVGAKFLTVIDLKRFAA